MEIGKTASGTDRVLHHPLETVDGIEVVAIMGREEVEAQSPDHGCPFTGIFQ
jgi:hypothetical protein